MPPGHAPSPLRQSQPLYADVIVPRHIARTFTYLVPAPLAQTLEIGNRVLVPFGRAILEGAVISLRDHPPIGMKAASLREICSLIDGTRDTGPASTLFELSRKIAERYVTPWGQCLRLIFPQTPPRKALFSRYVATEQGRAALNSADCPDHLRPLLDRIARRSRGVSSSTLLRTRDKNIWRTVEALEGYSWLAVTTSRADGADSLSRKVGDKPDRFDLGAPADQAQRTDEFLEPDPSWVTRMAEGLRAGRAKRILLDAPWEERVSCLVSAIQQAYAMNRSVIVLAGEAARAGWLSRLLSIITKLPVTFLRAPSRSDQWTQAQERTPSIVVGTRSAVFAPLRSIGLIWVDGEEASAFKEPQEPRYHARDVACMRAEVERALVVLASAHPSLESKMDADAESYIVQPETSHRPEITLVDLRSEEGGTLFSRQLVAKMQEVVENKAGVLLFLNRKGYAGALVCRDCGWIPRCPSCAVALTYYQHGVGELTCRYCGTVTPLSDCCPTCQASRLDSLGAGTERVEIEARRLFPNAKIARLDGDTLRRSGPFRRLWEGARAREWDIVIGTQVIFQRDPLPRMGLVGILQAESGLNIPDFRAAEWTYHLMVDAVSLARPMTAGGRVVLQTRLPAHHAVQAVLSGDPNRFYDAELAARRLLGYPPLRHLAALSVSGKEQATVEAAAAQWRSYLEGASGGEEAVTILGPVPAIGGRRKGSYRVHLLLKAPDRTVLCRRAQKSVERLEHEHRKSQIKFVVDMDPVEMGGG